MFEIKTESNYHVEVTLKIDSHQTNKTMEYHCCPVKVPDDYYKV